MGPRPVVFSHGLVAIYSCAQARERELAKLDEHGRAVGMLNPLLGKDDVMYVPGGGGGRGVEGMCDHSLFRKIVDGISYIRRTRKISGGKKKS